jgi:hypothetical protein
MKTLLGILSVPLTFGLFLLAAAAGHELGVLLAMLH